MHIVIDPEASELTSNSALSFSTGINRTPGDNSWPSLWVKQASIWARNRDPHKNIGVWGPIPWAPLRRPLPGYSFFSHSCQSAKNGLVGITFELRGGTLTRAKWRHFMSFLSMLWLSTFQMGLIICVSLLLLTPKVLSLPFDPQDNTFLSWAHCYAAFHDRSNCWVCRALPSSTVEGFPCWTFPFQGKDCLQVCKYLWQQQSYVMPLLNLMTSNNPKMDWSNNL